MDCALWLNKHKIYSADEIPDNPDIAALRGYYLGGCLEEWLRGHNGEEYADKLAALSCGEEELNGALAEIFGLGDPSPMRELRGELSEPARQTSLSGSGYPRGSFGSRSFGSFRFGSFHEWEWEWLFRFGSLGSYRLGSFRFGSFHEWEWEWLFRFGSLGSYHLGSFRFGSFHEWEWEWLFRFGSIGSYRLGSFSFGSFREWEWGWLFHFGSIGSYRLGSFRFGSFREWEWEWERLFRYGSFGSYRLGSFRFGSFGSYKEFPFDFGADGVLSGLDEYDRIMLLNLLECPLNRYGYGIHNI